ncbi:exodeoxyribonuclease V subunit gamma [Chrysiogenes arsenatis]|uniref:exodeoxyribonuclease V subunit gamma n=1 Tax=Chrysiogenes arsenatis TaxID=309797 RepID=UPI00041C480F|nr:exodeoxyribonuclease V subunit gamma [Chrysiogenes arsenatis]
MLTLHTGNSLTQLADVLVALMRTEPLAPLVPETIVVQSRGMDRWLELHIAQTLGVCANIRFPFPEAWLWELYRNNLGALFPNDQYAREQLRWVLYDLLDDVLALPELAPLRVMAAQEDAQTRFELCDQIADTFDRYQLYRPEWLLAWEKGENPVDHPHAPWQQVLWRALRQRLGGVHRGEAHQAFLRQFAAGKPLLWTPPRLFVFGITLLPPAHLQTLALIGHSCDVHLFVLSPCQEYWGDHPGRRNNEESNDTNRLLASLGKVGRDFQELLLAFDGAIQTYEYWQNPEPKSLLEWLQHDMLHRLGRGVSVSDESTEKVAAQTIAADDLSLQLHSAHTPLREVEVLKEQILDFLERHPSCGLHDIVVLVPNLERYAPLVEAVFQVTSDQENALACTIADRTEHRLEHEAFAKLLTLATSSVTLPAVLEVLELPPITANYGLTSHAIGRLQTLLVSAGAAWGIDASHRAQLGFAAEPRNTLRWALFNLQQAALHAAAPEFSEPALFPVTVDDNDVLATFERFLDDLAHLVTTSQQTLSLGAWRQALTQCVAAFLSAAETWAEGVDSLLAAIAQMALQGEKAAFATAIPFGAIWPALQQKLLATGRDDRFMAGKITICSMLPMRSIPFAMIAVLGMNDGEFPRQHLSSSFDLVARFPQRGDRNRLEDDRYLFLEAILCAGKQLHISYVGQDARRGTVLAPSVVVQELRDTINAGFTIDGLAARDVASHCTRIHPPLPFSATLFDGRNPALFSYTQQHWEIAHLLQQRNAGAPVTLPPFQERLVFTLPESLNIHELVQFFGNPLRRYVEYHQIAAPNEAREIPDSEPFDISPLDTWFLRTLALQSALAHHDAETIPRMLCATGKVPHGTWGERDIEGIHAAVQPLQVAWEALTAKHAAEVCEFSVSVDVVAHHCTVHGELTLYGGTLVFVNPGKCNGKRLLEMWIPHLLRCASQTSASPALAAYLLCLNAEANAAEIWMAPPIGAASAYALLRQLLECYVEGHTVPLPLPVRATWAGVEAAQKKEWQWDDAIFNKMDALWQGDSFRAQPGEAQESLARIAWRGVAPWQSEQDRFVALAEKIYRPMLEWVERKG